jgi:hypothetical protein
MGMRRKNFEEGREKEGGEGRCLERGGRGEGRRNGLRS